MPRKGDNTDASIARAITDHLSNECFIYSAPGAVHPSNKSVYGDGIFNAVFNDVANGMASNGPPTLDVEDILFCANVLTVKGKLTVGARGDFTVEEIQPSSRGRTIMGLRKIA